MSGIPYRGGRGDDPLAYGERPSDFGYGGRGGGGSGSGVGSGVGGGGNRWDTDRFASEIGGRGGRGGRFEERDVYEERDSRTTTRGGGFGRPRERSVDEIYERRGPGFGDDRYERRHYHDDDAPRFERAPQPPPFGDPWDRHNSTTVIEKERDVYSPPPPRRGSNRPVFLRRQSSLDTFDRKPLARFSDREEYGPPARYRPDTRPAPMVPIPLPLPKTRQLGPPPRRYAERDSYEEVRMPEPEMYRGDEQYEAYPERVREREVIRRRRRSRSRESVTSRRSHRSRRAESVRSDSISSSSSSDRETTRSVRNEFPKRGKTRMPARLVSKRAIIDLGYPFEEEGDTIIIMRALGRENIDEVIKLSESYNDMPSRNHRPRSDDGQTVIYEEHKTQEVITIPAPPQPAPIIIQAPAAPPPTQAPIVQEVVTDTKVVEHFDHRDHHDHRHASGPIIVNAGPQPSHHHHDVEIRETTQYVDNRDAIVISGRSRSRSRDAQAIREEIIALEVEKELLRRERSTRRGHRHHASGRSSNAELVMYDKEHFHANGEDVTIVRKEAIIEPDGGVRIEKDRKGRMAISVPKYIR